MNVVLGIFFVIAAIGAIAVAIPALLMAPYLWWIVIPLLGWWVGGWLGLFFGVGVCVILFVLSAALR